MRNPWASATDQELADFLADYRRREAIWARLHLEHIKRVRVAYREYALALKSEQLTRPLFCAECGAGGRIHGHHDDYSRPLDVRWLCIPCHAVADRVRRLSDPMRRPYHPTIDQAITERIMRAERHRFRATAA